jgi:hypothetical protein
MALALAVCLCLGSGFALVSLGWPRRGSVGVGLTNDFLADDLLLRISLSAGYGLGIFSVIFYLSLVSVLHFNNLLLADGLVFAALAAARAVQLRLAPIEPQVALQANNEGRSPAWVPRALTAASVAVLLIALYAEVMRVHAFPHGDGWDAFTIWNLHARFLFLGGAHWRDGFTTLVGGSHPDYPLLLPASIAHFWTFLDQDDARVPAVIGIVFTFATAGVLFAALAMLRGRVAAMMAAIALLSTPFFIEQGADQYADIPLSFFFLASVALLCFFDGPEKDDLQKNGRSGDDQRADDRTKYAGPTQAPSSSPRLLVLAGFAAGFAAWTKNEGLLFLCAIALSRVVIFVLRRRREHRRDHSQLSQLNDSLSRPGFWKDTVPLLLALLPGLLLVAYYKHSIGVRGDLFSDPANALTKLLEPSRYWTIFAGYVKGLFRFGHWLWIPGTLVLAIFSILWGRSHKQTRQPSFRTSALALSLTFVGYFGVFLITPYDLHWHLRFSLVRLFLQLWPSTLFLFFLVLEDQP